MSKTILFAVRDSKAGFYGVPFSKRSRGEAERDFVSLRRDQQTKVAQFPEDYDLFEVGEYDELSGKITAYETPKHMMKAIDIAMS